MPNMDRHDGYYDKKLKAKVYTWRDVKETRVGFVYEFSPENVILIYFSPVESKFEVKMHRTRARKIEDPDQFGGWRLDTEPDPDNDETVELPLPEGWI